MDKLTRNQKKLKIVFLDFDDIKNPLLGAGQARATVEVGKRLVEKGHKITVICSRFPGYKDRIENGLQYIHIGLGTKNIRLNNFAYIFSIPLAISKIKDADVIIECFTAPISTLFSPLFTKIPVIALPTSFDAKRFAKLYHLPLEQIEKFGCRFYKYFLPTVKELDFKMKKYNPKVISKIVPQGVSEEYFAIKKKAPKYILFLGRLDMDQKGIDLLLKSFARIVNKIKYPLVIAGNGPDEQKVQALISRLNLQKKVRMIGPIFGDKKYKILEESLFVAIPSRNEGFCLFALEALATGLPLVSFDIPGLSWTDKRVSLKAKPFDINQYASLLLLANNSLEIKKMSANSRNFAKKFTWNNVVNEYESFFFEILENEKK